MEELTKKTQLKAVKKVLNEMVENQKIISDWTDSWTESYHNAYSPKHCFTNEVMTLQKEYNGVYNLEDIIHKVSRVGEPLKKETLKFKDPFLSTELECEFGKVQRDLDTNKNHHTFTFKNNGEISYSKTGRKRLTQSHPTKTECGTSYNVLSNDFLLKMLYTRYVHSTILHSVVDISLDNHILKLNYHLVDISFNLKTGKRTIDFKTYENEGRKVNGVYRFETYDKENIDATFYSRKGHKIDLTADYELLEKAIQILSSLLEQQNVNISDLFDQTEEYLINLFSNLENTIPLVGMSERLNNCSNSIKQLKGIVRNLQK